MSFVFTSSDFRKIGKTLGVAPKHKGNNVRYELGGPADPRKLTLEVYPGIPIGKKKGNLVTVYTQNSHLQLHFCSGFVVSPMLREVTFVGEAGGKLAGLIVEKEGGCSLYANVERDILSGDFTILGPEVMLSGIALSLSESILLPPKKGRGRKKG
ncbi:MAG TPA: hypothetical protein VI932_06255 [Bacteroidota bacterium]|nr:hypothetical protein [Bacteroidota bacterium]